MDIAYAQSARLGARHVQDNVESSFTRSIADRIERNARTRLSELG